jgi:hypothetical protein
MEGNALHAAGVTSKLSAVFDIGSFGVPDADHAVCGARCDERAMWIPGDAFDPGKQALDRCGR